MSNGPIQPTGLNKALLLAMLTALGPLVLVAIGALADPTTTRGDLIVRGDASVTRLGTAGAPDAGVLTVTNGNVAWAASAGGGAGFPDAAGVADGAALVVAGGAQAWAPVVAGATVVDPMTGGGWSTTAAASTSATWAASSLTLSALAGATGRVEVAHAAVVDPGAGARDLIARVQVTAGDASGSTGYVLMIARADASNYFYLLMTAGGDLRVAYAIAGSATISGDVAGPSAGQRTGGQLWIRLHTDGLGRWDALWGVGSAGAVPATWARAHAVDAAGLAAAVPASSTFGLWVGSSGGTPLAATHTVVVRAIRSTWVGSL